MQCKCKCECSPNVCVVSTEEWIKNEYPPLGCGNLKRIMKTIIQTQNEKILVFSHSFRSVWRKSWKNSVSFKYLLSENEQNGNKSPRLTILHPFNCLFLVFCSFSFFFVRDILQDFSSIFSIQSSLDYWLITSINAKGKYSVDLSKSQGNWKNSMKTAFAHLNIESISNRRMICVFFFCFRFGFD